MQIEQFNPKSMLVTKETYVPRPKFPVIDAHNHLGSPIGAAFDQLPPAEVFARLDEVDVRVFVDLDGAWGEDLLRDHLDKFKTYAPDRFVAFGGIDWSAWPEHGDRFPEWAASRLRQQVAWGAQGLKVWKDFGLRVRDHRGELVKVDDPRLDSVWETAAELQIPITVHVADPVSFFEPLDERNEYYIALVEHPDWHFPSPPFPPFLEVVEGMANLVRRFPRVTWIGAHVGCYPENLNWVSALMDECPNFYVDISARISQLGRQPYSARRFFLQHPDRILFGTDFGLNLEMVRNFFRFLETDDEYFLHSLHYSPGLAWNHICGIYLPDDVLEKVYSKNAEKALRITASSQEPNQH